MRESLVIIMISMNSVYSTSISEENETYLMRILGKERLKRVDWKEEVIDLSNRYDLNDINI